VRAVFVLGLSVLMVPAWAQAYALVVDGPTVGDTPSRFSEISFPASRLTPRDDTSSAGLSQGGSSFALKSMDEGMRLKTEATLSTLGARQEKDRIVVDLPSDVLFDFDKADIRPEAAVVLTQLAGILKAMPDAPVSITGHTDSKGSDAYNQRLSERRAVSVRKALSKLSVAEGRMTVAGKGESQPVARNVTADGRDDPVGRQKNRRVEFAINTGD
jgi:outer membrane protein OmpA-like peptidoglycan-associated protein